MKQAAQSEAFEQVLLDHVDLCYSVALALTQHPRDAQNLTRNVVSTVWQRFESTGNTTGIKLVLLSELHSKFLRDYRPDSFNLDGISVQPETSQDVLPGMKPISS